MDKARSKSFIKRLQGKICSGWSIGDYINCGKSAVVFKAAKGNQDAAIKFFDSELTERYGAEIQEERVNRELSLKGNTHPNLIQILDGGFWNDEELFFVAMEYLPWENLANDLDKIPVGYERKLIAQVASAARYLENLGICHRDIKPENIAISSDFEQVKLLDLGVIRPHGSKPITDGTHGKVFVGTLKYSPPEFLLRQEKDNVDGWRAITFYQLGAVLHDLIMRRALFSDYENPFALLVNAVQDILPEIQSKAVSPALVELSRYCLIKNPETRLSLVSWDAFEKEPIAGDQITSIKARLSKRLTASKSTNSTSTDVTRTEKALTIKLDEYASSIASICRLECIENTTLFPPVEIRHSPLSSTEKRIAIEFEPSKPHGLKHHLRIEVFIHWIDADNDIVEMQASAKVSRNPFSDKSKKGTRACLLFKGGYTQDSVKLPVVTALYEALDKAQQVDPNVISRTKTFNLRLEVNSHE